MVNYANPNDSVALYNQAPLQTTYNVNFSELQERFYNFPSDIEYFQVITGMTYNSFMGNLNPSNPNGFAPEYLNFVTQLKKSKGVISTDPSGNEYFTGYPVGVDSYQFDLSFEDENLCGEIHEKKFLRICKNEIEDGCEIQPIKAINNYPNMGIIIMVRGVDVTSPRVNVKYDLNRIFGYQYGTNTDLTVEGKFRLNIPVQPNLILPRHDQISDNSTINSGGALFFDSYNSDFSGSFSGYTSNMHTFYSSLDSTTIGFIVNPNYPWTELTFNHFTLGFQGEIRSNVPNGLIQDECYPYKSNNLGTYFGEYIEGAALAYQVIKSARVFIPSCLNEDNPFIFENCPINEQTFIYFAPKYSSGNILSVSNPNKIVFRSDRIPTSTTLDTDVSNSGALGAKTILQQGNKIVILKYSLLVKIQKVLFLMLMVEIYRDQEVMEEMK